MFSIALAAFLGGLPTAALLWPHGTLVTLLGAPLGGSTAGLAMALTLAATRDAEQNARDTARSGPRPSHARRGSYAWSR